MTTIAKPQVIFWAKAYLVFLSLIYAVIVVISPFMLAAGDGEVSIMGIVFLVLGVPLFFISIVPVFLPPKPWVWLYILIMIGLGMTSFCFLPVCIPLLIFWLKPEVKRYYGKIAQ